MGALSKKEVNPKGWKHFLIIFDSNSSS
jgi:hypothetical protein